MIERMIRKADLSKVLTKAHQNKWVALTPSYSKVIASDAKLALLTEKVKGKKVVFMRVPRMDAYFAPGFTFSH